MKNAIKLSATSSQNNGMAYYRHLLANRPHPLKNLDALATITSFHRGQKICSRDQTAEHQTLEHWYFLISGAVRRCAIRSDGHRQIVDLLLPGDFFGLAFGDQTDAIIEAAAQNTVVASYPRSRIELLADSDPKIARELRGTAAPGGGSYSVTAAVARAGRRTSISSVNMNSRIAMRPLPPEVVCMQ